MQLKHLQVNLSGANNKGQLKILVKRLFGWGAGIAILFTLIYIFFMEDILSILTDKQYIVELSRQYHIWVLLIPIAGFSAFLWDGIFIGATASHQMRNSMLISVVCFFLLYLSLNNFIGNKILWISFIIYLAMRGIVQTFMARSVLADPR